MLNLILIFHLQFWIYTFPFLFFCFLFLFFNFQLAWSSLKSHFLIFMFVFKFQKYFQNSKFLFHFWKFIFSFDFLKFLVWNIFFIFWRFRHFRLRVSVFVVFGVRRGPRPDPSAGPLQNPLLASEPKCEGLQHEFVINSLRSRAPARNPVRAPSGRGSVGDPFRGYPPRHNFWRNFVRIWSSWQTWKNKKNYKVVSQKQIF